MDLDWQVIGETRDRLGESALWHPREKALYWIDFYGPTVHRFDPANGSVLHWTPDGLQQSDRSRLPPMAGCCLP